MSRAARGVVLLAGLVLGCGARTGVRELPALDAGVVARDMGLDAWSAADAWRADDAWSAADAWRADDAWSGPDAWAPRDAWTPPCPGIGDVSGTWSGPGARARLTQTGDTIQGTWLTNSRPPFFGSISLAGGGCEVRVTFPDDDTFIAMLTAGGCEIDWSNGTVWRKDACP